VFVNPRLPKTQCPDLRLVGSFWVPSLSLSLLLELTYRKLGDRLDTLRHRHQRARTLSMEYRCIQARIRSALRTFLGPILQEDNPWQYLQKTGLSAEQQKDVAAYIDRELGSESAALFADLFYEISTIFSKAEMALVQVESLASARRGVSHQSIYY
jgi:hypothetical protein